MKKILIVGAGIVGSTIARILAEAGYSITLIDKRDHVGGNCYDYLDETTGERIHKFGPHLTHAKSEEMPAVEFLSRFTEWVPYEHRVRVRMGNGKEVPMPVNRETVETFFKVKFESDEECEAFLDSKREKIENPRNSYEVFLKGVGQELANELFIPYTERHWGKKAEEIEASVGARIPVSKGYEDRYFPNDTFQAMPKDGFTAMFERMLDHPNIEVRLNENFEKWMIESFDFTFTAQRIDEFFDFEYGILPYRSLKFIHDKVWGKQSATTLNFVNGPYNRRTVWEMIPNSPKSSLTYSAATYEIPCTPEEAEGEVFYPVRNTETNALYNIYKEKAQSLKNIEFVGRTGWYLYLDTFPACTKAMAVVKEFLK